MDQLLHEALQGKFDSRGVVRNDVAPMRLTDVAVDFGFIGDDDPRGLNWMIQSVRVLIRHGKEMVHRMPNYH